MESTSAYQASSKNPLLSQKLENWQTLPLNDIEASGYKTKYFVMSILCLNKDLLYVHTKSRCCDIITEVFLSPYASDINDYKYMILTPALGGKISTRAFLQCKNLIKDYLQEVDKDDFILELSDDKSRMLLGINKRNYLNRRQVFIFTKLLRFFYSRRNLPDKWRDAIEYFLSIEDYDNRDMSIIGIYRDRVIPAMEQFDIQNNNRNSFLGNLEAIKSK